MRLRSNQAGFSVVELVIVVAIVGLLGFVGYTIYNRQQDNKQAATNTNQQASQESPTASDVKPAPNVSSTADLDKAEAMLDQTDPGGSNNTDADQLNSQVANF